MTSLTLYKGVAFDGVNSFPDIKSKSAFDGYLSQRQQYRRDIHFNRIGEPILINKGYDTAIEYSYGRIDTGGKKYFIIPDSISVNENNRVYLTYSVDWFTTLEYDDALTFGRAHLIKSTDVSPLDYPQGIQPIDMRMSWQRKIGDYGEIHVAYTTDDDKSTVRWILSEVANGLSQKVTLYYGTEDEEVHHTIGVPEIMNGYLFRACDIAPNNILGIYYVPYKSPGDYPDYDRKRKEVDGKKYTWLHLHYEYHNPRFSHLWLDFQTSNIDLTASAYNSVHLIDRYGSIIYSVPYGRTLKRVIYEPILTPASAYIAFEFFYDDDLPPFSETTSPTPSQNAENSFALYMCEKIDYNNDAYANWASGYKGIEIEERRIQKNKSLMAGLGGAGITGAIGGAGGNPIGAVAGVAGGVAGALLSYGIDTYYESNVNSLEDRKYQLAQDTMIPGGFLLGVDRGLSIITLRASDEDIARYNDEISNFGADCNLPVGSWTPSKGAYKFTDVEVIADVPYSIKENIKRKMTSGIKIVRLS